MPNPASSGKGAIARRALSTFFLLLWTGFVAVSSYHWFNYTPPDGHPPVVRLGLSLFFLAGPLWVLGRRLRGLRRPLPPSLAASALLTAGVAVFLAWLAQDDETWRHSERPPALRNDFPEAAATHALTLRYSTTAPGSLSATLPRTKLSFPSGDHGPKNDAQWATFLEKNGVELDRLWVECAPLRAWIDELAAAPALGDLTDKFDSPILGFQALRLAGQTACARARQLVAEGRRDEAVEILLPVLAVGQKLEPHARTLVRRMISIVLRRQVQNTLASVLDGGAPSPATRARLARALASASNPAEQGRLLALSEYGILSRTLLDLRPEHVDAFALGPSAARLALRPLFPLLYNPRRTANLAGDHFVAVGEAAARRDFKAVAALGEARFTGPAVSLPGKNHAGRLLLAMAAPAYEKVIESHWKAEDERLALLARLSTH